MKKMILIGILILMNISLFSESPEEYITSAKSFERSDIFKAIDIMERAAEEYPENVDVLSFYGLMVSKGSGQASMLKAGAMVYKAESIFGQALDIDSSHKNARLWRGILRVNVPKFFNKLSKGIADLDDIAQRPGLSNDDYLVTSYYLAFANQRKGNDEKAIEYYKNIVRYGSDSQFYQDSLKQLQELTGKSSVDVEAKDKLQSQADAFINAGKYHKAYQILTEATKQDTTDIDLYLKYLNVIQVVSHNGYDEKVYDDVAFMTDLAFNVAYALNRIVILMPDNEDFRLLKAQVLSQLLFFVQSLQEAENEVNWILVNSNNQDNIKHAKDIQASINNRIERRSLTDQFLATEDEEVKNNLVKQMQYDNTNREEPQGLATKITLSLAFADYIAPQTAVWIEDIEGNYLTTVYISAFSANIKEKQVHLPKWAKSSQFEDAIVRVTGASIDSGKHVFYWDNKDAKGKLLSNGDYFVCAEVSHWPHANYSLQKVKLTLGGKSYRQTTQGDYLISELKVEY